jgi:hypothetical protein
MQIRPVGAELFHADGQTNMTKLIVAFRNFANAPENTALDRLFGLWTYCADLPQRVRFDLRISLSRPLVSHSACHSLLPTGQRGSVGCGVFLPCRCFKWTHIFTATPPVFLHGMVLFDKARVVLPLGGEIFHTRLASPWSPLFVPVLFPGGKGDAACRTPTTPSNARVELYRYSPLCFHGVL